MICLEKINYWRLLRRAILLAVVLVLLVACSAQVKAENEPLSTEQDAVGAVPVQEAGLTEENFSAVAVQLKAVARAEGCSISDRMMHTALRAAAAQTETAVTPMVAREGNLNVIVVPKEKPTVSVEKIFVLAFVIFASVLMMISVCTRSRKMRRTVYKPMRMSPVQNSYYARYNTVRTYR